MTVLDQRLDLLARGARNSVRAKVGPERRGAGPSRWRRPGFKPEVVARRLRDAVKRPTARHQSDLMKVDGVFAPHRMLDSYPRRFNVDASVLAATTDALNDSAQACTEDVDDDLSEQNVPDLVNCIRLGLRRCLCRNRPHN